MELPNYSQQLMQQLHTLRKDGQFCDCTIVVGDVVHSAHKVVLAASSLLFKSLLENSDRISIDTTMISPVEFSSLLDLAYMGKVAPGQHDFTQVIAAADNLQMFDVAVGCKTVHDRFMKQAQDHRQGSAVSADDAQVSNDCINVPVSSPRDGEELASDSSLIQKDLASQEGGFSNEVGRAFKDQQNPVSKLTDHLIGVDNIHKMLTQAADKCTEKPLKEVLLECSREMSFKEVLRRLVSMLSEDELEEILVLLLKKMEGSTKDTEESIYTAEVKYESPAQMNDDFEKDKKQEEDEQVNEKEKKGGTRKRKRKRTVMSYMCQWCNKSFDFKCRLLTHKQKCVFSPDRAQRCTECSLAFPSVSALQEHSTQAHNAPLAKKKKPQPVQCDVCGKTFKHPSGLLYHKRTEHLEERPYSCKDCGAKFAANSSLKNHMRLHTGEKPYQCVHCDMRFAVAASLSYHTKKKHSEGKMFECQYCSATFAQSIELTRHIRTHTGDKPYVCRQCGKGFKQANGLSMHLQTFHNVTDPHDCQKCRVSFGSLEKLREHIQEVHPKELHECPECSRIFSSGSQLDKHMSTHDGSKPYKCKNCNKSYQTLSGLWYHNRTIHTDLVKAGGSHRASHPLQCKICSMTFCNKSSEIQHQLIEHPEMQTVIVGVDEKEEHVRADVHQWRCIYCSEVLNTEQGLQQHVSSEHINQQESSSSCVICALSFASEPELQQHYVSNHVQVIQEEKQHVQHSPSHMVTDGTLADEAVPIAGLEQSQPDDAQVFVAVGDGQEEMMGSSPGVVTVNMEDLLTGSFSDL